jgi:eukaryotic-like serine/threonine-protein kinase
LMVLEGCARHHGDVIAPILKTIVIDPGSLAVYLIMSRLRGSLTDCIERGYVRRMNLDNIARQLSYLLRCVHGAGILHLDIKTCNILVGEDDMLVIADFGMARMMGGDGKLELRGREVMTVTHRTPELLLGDKVAGEWSDVWAMALVMY